MNDQNYAAKQVYKVLIKAPIDKVWSELVGSGLPAPTLPDTRAGWQTGLEQYEF